jgi:glucan biosynthesis protein
VSFGDVSAEDWSYNYISAAASNKIVNGYSDKIFGKNDYVTKQDLAVMIYRAAKASGALPSTLNDMEFSDYENISQYAKEAVEALADAGIINGYNGMFMPSSNATRAETAKILAAFVN